MESEYPDLNLILGKLKNLPKDTKSAIEFFTKILTENMPQVLTFLKTKSAYIIGCESSSQDVTRDSEAEAYFLCHNLILKYTNMMVDIFKEETENSCILQESRSWALLRTIWCLEKFNIHHQKSLGLSEDLTDTSAPNFLETCDGDEFITWVDDSLDLQDLFTKLFQNDTEKYNLQNGEADKLLTWKNECTTGLLKLRGVIIELVASAMKICQNCLPPDQSIIIARCHVVFRESKMLMAEILTTDLSMEDGIDPGKIKLKDDLHYPTVRLLNDVLRDAIYNVEASINRAVLGLVLGCMVYPVEPLQRAVQEQVDNRRGKTAIEDSAENMRLRENNFQETDLDENENFIEEFDVHNERLLQIGLFAVSCSADQQRISMLKSCLASLEALEPHLVPSILSDPRGLHSQILSNHWSNEINSLRALVFLIIDPVAFIELVMEKYRHQLMQMKGDASLQWNSIQHLIGLGKSVLDFIQIYTIHEPKSFPQLEKLTLYTVDLRKVLKECRVITNLFLTNPSLSAGKYSNGTLVAEPAQSNDQKQKEVRILKRLKLLYALLLNISKEIIGEQSIDDDEASGEEDQSEQVNNNLENDLINQETYIKFVTSTIPVKARSDKSTPKVPQRSKGILGILQNFKGNIRQGTLFGCDILKKGNAPPSNACTINKSFSRTYIARKTPNFKKRNTSHQRISKILDYQRKRSVSTLVLNTEEFLLADISIQDQTSVMQHVAGLTQNSQFSDETSKRVMSLLNESSKNTRRHRRSLRKQLLKNRTICNNLGSPISKNCSRSKPMRSLSKSMNSVDVSLDYSLKASDSIDWHITEILEQLTGLSDTLSLLRIDPCEGGNLLENSQTVNKETDMQTPVQNDISVTQQKHIVTLKINDVQLCSPKKVWNIRVNDTTSYTPNCSGSRETPLNEEHVPLSNTINCGIDVSFGSNIPTPERMNDINLLEQKLADLRDFWK